MSQTSERAGPASCGPGPFPARCCRNRPPDRHVIRGIARHRTRTVSLAAAALVLGLTTGGCGSEDASADGPPRGEGAATGGSEPTPAEQGDSATWVLEGDALLDPGTTFFMAGVTRLGCAGGETGEVLEPQVVYEQERVLVRTDAAPLGSVGADCPGNDTVPVEVHLDEPLGVRALVDAACVEGEAVGTTACCRTGHVTCPHRTRQEAD